MGTSTSSMYMFMSDRSAVTRQMCVYKRAPRTQVPKPLIVEGQGTPFNDSTVLVRQNAQTVEFLAGLDGINNRTTGTLVGNYKTFGGRTWLQSSYHASMYNRAHQVRPLIEQGSIRRFRACVAGISHSRVVQKANDGVEVVCSDEGNCPVFKVTIPAGEGATRTTRVTVEDLYGANVANMPLSLENFLPDDERVKIPTLGVSTYPARYSIDGRNMARRKVTEAFTDLPGRLFRLIFMEEPTAGVLVFPKTSRGIDPRPNSSLYVRSHDE